MSTPITPEEARELTAPEEAYLEACMDVLNPLIQERFESTDVEPFITLEELTKDLENHADGGNLPYSPDLPRIRRALKAAYEEAGWVVEYASTRDADYFRFSEKDPPDTELQ